MNSPTRAEEHGLIACMVCSMMLWALLIIIPIGIAGWITSWLDFSKESGWVVFKWTLIIYFVIGLCLSYLEAVGKGPEITLDVGGLVVAAFCVQSIFENQFWLFFVIYFGWFGLRFLSYLTGEDFNQWLYDEVGRLISFLSGGRFW